MEENVPFRRLRSKSSYLLTLTLPHTLGESSSHSSMKCSGVKLNDDPKLPIIKTNVRVDGYLSPSDHRALLSVG